MKPNPEKDIVRQIIQGALNPAKGVVSVIGPSHSGRGFFIEKAYQTALRLYRKGRIDRQPLLIENDDEFDKEGYDNEILFCLFPVGVSALESIAQTGVGFVVKGVAGEEQFSATWLESVFVSDIYTAEHVQIILNRHFGRSRFESFPTFMRTPEGITEFFITPLFEATGLQDDKGTIVGTVLPPGIILSVAYDAVANYTQNLSISKDEMKEYVERSANLALDASRPSLFVDPDVALLMSNGNDIDAFEELREELRSVVSTPKTQQKQPVKKIEIKNPTETKKVLKTFIAGQDEAIETVTSLLETPYAFPNGRPKGPIFSAFFCGPTGVGKTELAKLLATYGFDRQTELIRIDCSEFAEKHEVAKLYGAPPGYAGYGEGGKLTNAVKANPHAVILLDEAEKAHWSVWDSFLQILDDGVLTDGQGEKVDFSNTAIIFTSNLGTKGLLKKSLGFGDEERQRDVKTLAKKEIDEFFRPEFLNRIDSFVFFNFLSDAAFTEIVDIKMRLLLKRLTDNSVHLDYDTDEMRSFILSKLKRKDYGARELVRVIEQEVLQKVSHHLVSTNRKATELKVNFGDALTFEGKE